MANKRIPDLTAAASFALTNLFEISDGTATSKKVTGTQVQAGFTGKQDALGFTPENIANKSTDGTFAANSDTLYPSQKATKTYVDAVAGGVPPTRTISTTGPLAGGGDLSADRTFSIADAVADGATKGAASFLAADFTSAAGVIGIDYVNGQKATTLVPGFLTAADWTTFNSKQAALGFTPPPNTRLISTTTPLAGGGDLTADRTLSIADAVADGATKGAATFTASDFNTAAGVVSIDYTNGQKATALVPGFLTAADWTTFNSKQAALGFTPPPNTRLISTTSPLAGGGDLTADRTLSITDAAADGATKGAAAFTAADFNAAAGVISIDYTNGQAASAVNKGFLTSADWSTFNSKQSALGFTPPPNTRLISTTSPLAGGGDLTADRTLSIADAAADGATKGAATFTAVDFNSAAGVISIDYVNGQKATAAQPGFLTAADWTTFNSKASTEAPFVDTTAIVKGSADATKLLRFEVDGFTTGTTRIATPPNQDFTIAGINVAQTFSVTQTFTPAANNRSINVAGAVTSGASSLEFLRVSGTWSTSGTPAAMLVDITDAGSNAASKLADFQIASSSVFSIGKTGALNFLDNIRQTFNPGANAAGINVGSVAGDPGTLVNGDLWYESGANELHARINGATVALGAGGSSPPFDDGTAIIKGSSDPTKLFRIEVDGFTTATTRVATPPNQDFTMAGVNVAQTFTMQQTFVPPLNTQAIIVSGFSLTGSNTQSIIDISGEWNTSGSPSAISLNITDTSSAAGSTLINLKVGGVSKFYVNKTGGIVGLNDLNLTNGILAGGGVSAPSFSSVLVSNATVFSASGFSLTGANGQSFIDLAGTWNTSGTPTAIKLNVTDTASNAASKLLDLQVGSVSKFAVSKTGEISFPDGVRQTFNPDATNSGFNAGSNAADPSSPSNGDLWYQSTANELRARINGATVALGAGGSSPPFTDTTAIVKGSADATKLLRFEVDGFTTGTTRVATPPNQDFTMAGIDVQQTFTQRQTITPPANTAALVVSGASLTGASTTTFLDFSGTWNTSGIATAFKLNITDTASNSDSLLMDLQVGGNGKFTIGKGGDVVAAAGAFVVATTGNISLFEKITFTNSGVDITDSGGNIVMGAPLQLSNAAAAETPTATHTLVVKDSGGNSYRLLCLPV